MKKLLVSLSLLILALMSVLQGSGWKASAQDDFSAQANMLKVPRDYTTIQAAVNAAHSGDTIKVAEGVYNENVVISVSGLRLKGSEGTVIDGAGLTGTGILVVGTATQRVADVEVSGFEVRGFQRGIVLQFTNGARITANDVHDNNQSPGPPTNLDQATGIDLVTATSSDLSENSVHNNVAAGIQLRVGSTNNVVRANKIFENGALLTSDMTNQLWIRHGATLRLVVAFVDQNGATFFEAVAVRCVWSQ